MCPRSKEHICSRRNPPDAAVNSDLQLDILVNQGTAFGTC